MKLKDVTSLLKSFGWAAYKDEVGDRYTIYKLPDRTVQIIYGLDRIRDQQKFGSTLSTSTDVFAGACGMIYGDNFGSWPLISARPGLDIRAPEILEEHVQQASEQAIAWAQSQDLDEALRKHAALPTDAPGTGPILHLASLAILGEVEKLKSYQASFEAGDRLGFVPYVKKDFIDRAVALAQELATKS
jgi:hypothetical protein